MDDLIEGYCRCGNWCSTHDDANDPLDRCKDCWVITCQDCREHHQHVLDVPGSARPRPFDDVREPAR
jgi:hypothetical protein